MASEEAFGGATEPPGLLGADRLERVAETLSRARLHLDEDQPAAAPDDDVELVPSGAGVRREHAVAAQEVVQPNSLLGFSSRLPRAHVRSSGPRRNDGGSGSGPDGARPRNAPA